MRMAFSAPESLSATYFTEPGVSDVEALISGGTVPVYVLSEVWLPAVLPQAHVADTDMTDISKRAVIFLISICILVIKRNFSSYIVHNNIIRKIFCQ
jgi:hypothetical protein